MFRFLTVLIAVAFISGCENIDDISGKPRPIGEFALGHNIVVAPSLVKGPASREADKDEFIAAVKNAIDARFSRYEGDQLYHFGISLEGYVLAQPGIPLVLSPKSALILKITVWDDAAGKKLNEEPEQITILESVDGDSIVGSGLTKTAEEQMEALAVNAAKMIQRWISRQHSQERWFKKRADADTADDAVVEDEEKSLVETSDEVTDETPEDSTENNAEETLTEDAAAAEEVAETAQDETADAEDALKQAEAVN